MAVEAVAFVIQKLSDFLNEESEIFEKVDEVKRVMDELREMQSFLNDSQYQEQTNTVLRFLGIVCHVEDTIESFFIETRLKKMGSVKKHIIAKGFNRRREGSPDKTEYLQNVHKLKSEMEGFRKQIQEWKDGIGASSAQAPPQGSHEQPRMEEIITKRRMAMVLKQEIVFSDSGPLKIISVFGENGTETAAQTETIYNSRDVKKKFDCRVLQDVDTNWSVRRLILGILKQVIAGFVDKAANHKDQDLIGTLREFLEGKRYLIVINDITSFDLLEKLRGALPDANNGSKVVITTPDEGAASFADEGSRYCYKPLDKTYGFKKFKEEVEGLVKESPLSDVIKGLLKEKVASICRGNPQRIKLLAGFLSAKEKIYEDWSSLDKQLDFANNSPSFDIIAFCYNDLPPHLKPCFLYLGLFQKGFEIPVRRLFRLWLAEGFVKPIQGISPEDTVEASYLTDLVQRNMVEISKRRSDESPMKCRMILDLHDIFSPRDVKIGLFHLHQSSEENSYAATDPHQFGVRGAVECINIEDSTTSEAFNQNLQSSISLNNQKKDMFADDARILLETITRTRGFGLLKVLDLEGVVLPQLPENLGKLFHLRYLGLRNVFLKTLPSSLGALLHLQTLDIKHTPITTVPSSIWSMKHLRHLCLNGARLDVPVQSTEHTAPHQLQTLQGLLVDEKIAGKILPILKDITNLRKLDLRCKLSSTSHPSFYEGIGLWISSLSSLQSLRLRSTNRKDQPSELNIIKDFSSLENLSQLYLLGNLLKPLDWYKIPPGLKVLTLSVSQLDEDPMPTLSKLESLIDLRLLATSYVGKELCFPANGFRALRVLKLWKLDNLEVLTVNEGSMPKLHTLEIRCCEKLIDKKVPDTLLKIAELRKLILINMRKPFVTAMKSRKEQHYEIEVDSYMKSTSER